MHRSGPLVRDGPGPSAAVPNEDGKMSEKKHHKRRRWLVHPRYQLRFALGLVALNLSVGFLYQVALHYRVRELARRSGSLEAFLQTDPWTSIWPAMVVATFFSVLVVFYIGIRYSHQIVGPLPRLTRTLGELARGKNPPPLEVRSGDVLDDLATAINRLAAAMHGAPGTRTPTAEPQAEPEPAAEAATEEVRIDPESILGPARDRESVHR